MNVSHCLATSVLAVSVVGVGCRQAPQQAPPSRKVLRLSMGAPSGPIQLLGKALADADRTRLPDVDIEVRPSDGAVSNVNALQAGDADIGTTYADVAYFAFVGQLEPDSQPLDRLRGITVLPLSPVNLVVRSHSGIHDVAGLRRRRVALVGVGTALTAQVVLKAYGIGLEAIHIERLPTVEAARRVADGTLDAMFINGYPEPLPALLRAGARILPLSGPVIDRLRSEYPFLRPMRIPEGVYPEGAIPTIGVNLLLLCRSDLDEDLVYRFTKSFFEVLPVLPTVSPLLERLRVTDVEQAPATPIPLHEGAARYYREREVFR